MGLNPAERFSLAAVAYRDDQPESWHFAAAAVATPAGRLVASLGDPLLSAPMRSGAKPFQALPLLLAGGAERYGLEAPDLALICASHAGTEEHLARVASLLERGGFSAGDLQCGAHPPFDEAAARALRRGGGRPTPLHNNCSGKHAGMLLACRLLDLPVAGYLEADHPLQQRIRAEVQRFAALEARQVATAIDGCGVPCYCLPLSAAARAFAALADPVSAGLGEERRRAVGRIVGAMTAEPGMVAGPGRFTTRLMETCGGRILAKEGADGFYAAAVRGPVALGVALKIADGSEACRDGVVLELLRQLGSLSGEEFESLRDLRNREIRNWSGAVVGRLVPELELRQA